MSWTQLSNVYMRHARARSEQEVQCWNISRKAIAKQFKSRNHRKVDRHRLQVHKYKKIHSEAQKFRKCLRLSRLPIMVRCCAKNQRSPKRCTMKWFPVHWTRQRKSRIHRTVLANFATKLMLFFFWNSDYLEAPDSSFMYLTIDPSIGITNEVAPNKYEIIRRALENSIPNFTVHIYGSCLYMGNPDNDNALDLHIELSNFSLFDRIYLENGKKIPICIFFRSI